MADLLASAAAQLDDPQPLILTGKRIRSSTRRLLDSSPEPQEEKPPAQSRAKKAPKKAADGKVTKPAAKSAKKDLQSPRWNTSKFRGVTMHRRSKRWEAHIWIGGINKQKYLGGYEKEEHAAEAYDMAALKTKGFDTPTNFDKSRYQELKECLLTASLEEVVTAVRRQSQGFSRGTSVYRGVSPHPSGRFEARIGIAGNKHVYLGLFDNEGDAARAYDRAVVRIKGSQASTNFTLGDYAREMREHARKLDDLEVLNMRFACCTDQTYQRWVREGYQDDLCASQNGSEAKEN